MDFNASELRSQQAQEVRSDETTACGSAEAVRRETTEGSKGPAEQLARQDPATGVPRSKRRKSWDSQQTAPAMLPPDDPTAIRWLAQSAQADVGFEGDGLKAVAARGVRFVERMYWDAHWVFEHLGIDVRHDECPTASAWTILWWARSYPSQFFGSFLPNLCSTRADLIKIRKQAEADIRKIQLEAEAEIARLDREEEAAQAAARAKAQGADDPLIKMVEAMLVRLQSQEDAKKRADD